MGTHMALAAIIKKDPQWRNFLFFLDALRSCLRSRFAVCAENLAWIEKEKAYCFPLFP